MTIWDIAAHPWRAPLAPKRYTRIPKETVDWDAGSGNDTFWRRMPYRVTAIKAPRHLKKKAAPGWHQETAA